MDNKQRYRTLCETEISIPIYSRDWWLDCVCGEDNWDVLIYDEKDRIEAAMPYYRLSRNIITMPSQCQTMGIWFNPAFEHKQYPTNLHRRRKISTWFIENLPSHKVFLQTFHHSYTDWLPFYWKGYKQTVRYTYILPDISDHELLFENIKNNVHRNLKKAKRNNLEIRKGIPVEQFLTIYGKTFINKGMKVYAPDKLHRLIDKSVQRGQGEILGAYDKSGNLCAALFVVWQESCAYHIAGSSDPDYKEIGAFPSLIWETIRFVSSYSRAYDFEGSMLPGVERLCREFGGIQFPYFQISKNDNFFTRKLQSILRRFQ